MWSALIYIYALLYALSEICSVLMRNIYVSWMNWFSPPLTPTRLDWYIFYSSLIPSSIFHERLVQWAISSSFYCYMLSQKYVLFWCGTYMFHENLNILFLIMGKKVPKSWTFSPFLLRNRIDKYMFHSSLIPSPILRKR